MSGECLGCGATAGECFCSGGDRRVSAAAKDGACDSAPPDFPHLAAVEYARAYVVPLYRNGEEGTPYERGMIRQVAAHFLAGWFAAPATNGIEAHADAPED